MPVVSPDLLGSVFYLYNKEKPDHRGDGFVGTGFFIHYNEDYIDSLPYSHPKQMTEWKNELERFPSQPNLSIYAVTCLHNIYDMGELYMRVNVNRSNDEIWSQMFQCSSYENNSGAWKYTLPEEGQIGNDLAIADCADLGLPLYLCDFVPIRTSKFCLWQGVLSEDLSISGWGYTSHHHPDAAQTFTLGGQNSHSLIHAGQEVFMVGAFSTITGEERNEPTARFGNVAKAKPKKIPPVKTGVFGEKQPTYVNYHQPSIYLEMRSVSGFSGSPAFLVFHGSEYFESVDKEKGTREERLQNTVDWLLLGLHIAQVKTKTRLYHEDGTPMNMRVLANSAVTQVVPASEILKALDLYGFKDVRIERQNSYKKQKEQEIVKGLRICDEGIATSENKDES